MADKDGITTTQSFTERTLKYGRNMMAAAVPIIVFALVPVVDLAKSRPLNFEITAGGEIWIWVILLALLAYYGFRIFGLAIPDIFTWRREHGSYILKQSAGLKTQIEDEKAQRDTVAKERWDYRNSANPDEKWRDRIASMERNADTTQIAIELTRSKVSDYYWRRTYFWLADAGLPVALFAVAAIAATREIIALLPATD